MPKPQSPVIGYERPMRALLLVQMHPRLRTLADVRDLLVDHLGVGRCSAYRLARAALSALGRHVWEDERGGFRPRGSGQKKRARL